ncbi:MAG: carbohydrate binding domain-containing protein, partial [Oscillospiraceae bacterium]|nr:carbohydrate binding domain-containing protein [Oscillospiraceae bacterium]
MRMKKLVSALTALLCCFGTTAVFPDCAVHAEELVYNDFEQNYDGWYGNADAVRLTAEKQAGYQNSRGMLVSGRASAEDGASSAKGFYLSGGVEYAYSAQVFSKTEETFHLSLLCIDQNTGEETLTEIATQKVKPNQWTELTGNYTAPENSYEFRLTITTETTNDFAFDNVSITSKSAGI